MLCFCSVAICNENFLFCCFCFFVGPKKHEIATKMLTDTTGESTPMSTAPITA